MEYMKIQKVARTILYNGIKTIHPIIRVVQLTYYSLKTYNYDNKKIQHDTKIYVS